MKNKIIMLVSLILLVIVITIVYKNNSVNDKLTSEYDAIYTINGEKVTLKNGFSETSVENSNSKIITKVFGNQLKHDLNEDGIKDIVFLISQETGGSGVFYYVVARINTPEGPLGSDAVFLGDRIAPQTINIDEGSGRVNVIVVNYAERNPGEPMTTPPSLGKSLWLKLDPKTMQFGIVEQNFPGEADVNKMSLDMKKWNWIKTQYSNDKIVTPNIPEKFSITFKKDGSFSIATDCNNAGGSYMVENKKITFGTMFMTEMYCENSQENEFLKMIEQTESFMFTSKGEMILLLKYDSGSVIFK